VWPSEHAERNHLVVGVMADVGAAEKRDAGALAPVAGDLLAGRAEIGIVAGDVGNAAQPNPGDAAVRRALAWLADRAPDSLEPGLERGTAYAAFNLTVLGLLTGTALEPDLGGHVLLIEDVAEHAYRTDRALFHLTGQAQLRRIAGIRLGRVSDIPENDPDFGATSEEIARYWCERSGIPFLGRADIGHDADNKIVPFGVF